MGSNHGNNYSNGDIALNTWVKVQYCHRIYFKNYGGLDWGVIDLKTINWPKG